jgi:YHS domain-containing protein
LEGYCPVRLTERQQWVQGDQRWAVRYQGRTFWFASATERKRFLAAPQRYLPAYGGNDPVLAAEENRRAVGKVQYCVVYGDDNRLYLFASQATLEQFRDDPKRYAVRPSRGTP